MKIKILRGDSGKWYYNTDNVGKEFCIIKYYNSGLLRFLVGDGGGYWVDNDDCVITELPESFCVKRCGDTEKWKKYIKWLNKTYYRTFGGYTHTFYGVIDNRNGLTASNDESSFGTELHIDDIIKHIDFYSEPMVIESKEEKKMETQKLTRQGLKEIHSVACGNWKAILEGYSIRNSFEDYIELTQGEVDNMFNACTKEQLPIVSKYLKQNDGTFDLREIRISENDFIEVRDNFEYKNKSFYLNDDFNWEIKKDSNDILCLIPTENK